MEKYRTVTRWPPTLPHPRFCERLRGQFPWLTHQERGVRTGVLGWMGVRLVLRGLSKMLGRSVEQDDVEPYLWSVARLNLPSAPVEDFLETFGWRQDWAWLVTQWWASGFDLLLTPTVCEPPATLAEMTPPPDKPWELVKRVGQHAVFTQPFNVTGQPAISLPLRWTPEGLRHPQLTDALAIFEEYCQDPEVTKYLIWRPHKDIQETTNFLTGCLERWKSGAELTWGITHKGNERVIGMVASRVRGHVADIGYVVARPYWNRGYGAEVARAVVEWAANLESIFRVWAVCDTDNKASARVLEKAGMSCEEGPTTLDCASERVGRAARLFCVL